MAIGSIDPGTPTGADPVSEGDNQFNALKLAIKDSFVGFTGTPAGNDVVATKTGPEIEDGAEKSGDETITGSWTFDAAGSVRFNGVGLTQLGNNVPLSGVNVANSSTIPLIKRNASDEVELGDAAFLTRISGNDVQFNARIFADSDLAVSGNLTLTGDVIGGLTVQGVTLLNNDVTISGQLDHNGIAVGFYATTPTVQATDTGPEATYVANADASTGANSTFDGYTLQQVVRALRTIGILE